MRLIARVRAFRVRVGRHTYKRIHVPSGIDFEEGYVYQLDDGTVIISSAPLASPPRPTSQVDLASAVLEVIRELKMEGYPEPLSDGDVFFALHERYGVSMSREAFRRFLDSMAGSIRVEVGRGGVRWIFTGQQRAGWNG